MLIIGEYLEMVKKVAVMGSCLTRDNFNSKFNRNYKMFFEVVAATHQTSMLSLMSEPINYLEKENLEGFRDFDKWQLRQELNKEFLQLITTKEVDYLIMDSWVELYYSVINLGDGNFVSDNPKFKNLKFFKNQHSKINILQNTDAYLNIWKEKVDAFFAYTQEHIPNVKIILNQSRFGDTMENGTTMTDYRKKRNFKMINVEKLNRLWDILDDYIINNYDVLVIDMKEKSYLLDENHPWGAFYVYYSKPFYDDFLHKLIKIDEEQTLLKVNQLRQCVVGFEKSNADLERKLMVAQNSNIFTRLKNIKNKMIN